MRVVARILAGVVVIALAVTLVVRNTEARISVDLLVAQFSDVPAWQVMVVSLLAGATLAGLACSWPIVRYRLRLRRSGKRVADLEQELHGLRTLPLGGEDEPVESRVNEA